MQGKKYKYEKSMKLNTEKYTKKYYEKSKFCSKIVVYPIRVSRLIYFQFILFSFHLQFPDSY